MSLSLCGWPGAGHAEMFHGGKQHPQTQGLLKLDLCCFPPSWPVPVPPWSCLTGVAMPHHSCTRIWPQPLPAMGLANSLQLNRQQEWCPQEFVRTCPEPIPLLAVAWVCFTPAISASKHIGGKSLGIFFFPLKWQFCKAFFSGYSFPFSSRPAEWAVFPLPGSDLPACSATGCLLEAAGGEERAGRGHPCGETSVGCAQHGKRLRAGELPALGSFSSINKRKTSSSPLEYVCALEERHAADGEGKSCQ